VTPDQVPSLRALPSRVLDATLTCFARVGVGKTTLDDVAREAGCSRATVYRSFPGKQPLINAVIAREAVRMSDVVITAARAEASLPDAAVAALTTGARLMLDHEALRFVLTVEPELLVPYLSFEWGDALLAAASRQLAPAFEDFLDGERAVRLAEWLVRIGLSYLCSPEAADLLDELRVRALVEDFVLPGLDRPVPSEGIIPS
jgi:TetR/AcrR family transcriptional repressor of uid operon